MIARGSAGLWNIVLRAVEEPDAKLPKDLADAVAKVWLATWRAQEVRA